MRNVVKFKSHRDRGKEEVGRFNNNILRLTNMVLYIPNLKLQVILYLKFN